MAVIFKLDDASRRRGTTWGVHPGSTVQYLTTRFPHREITPEKPSEKGRHSLPNGGESELGRT
jgi:hypothetical protein